MKCYGGIHEYQPDNGSEDSSSDDSDDSKSDHDEKEAPPRKEEYFFGFSKEMMKAWRSKIGNDKSRPEMCDEITMGPDDDDTKPVIAVWSDGMQNPVSQLTVGESPIP